MHKDTRIQRIEVPESIRKLQRRDAEGTTKLTRKIIAHTDGGSRGNPGPGAAGFVLRDADRTVLQAKGFCLGRTTNNVAEYTGLVRALEAALHIGADHITVFSDSELLVRQINGQYKVKSAQIKPLFNQAMDILAGFRGWQVQHVTRDKNKHADELVNAALDRGCDVDQTPATRKRYGVKPVRLGVLISGGGRTMLNILDAIEKDGLPAQITLVVSSRSTVAGVERARNAGLDVAIVRTKDFADVDAFSKRIEQELVAAEVDLVVQGGWLCLWKIPKPYANRVMNIHPALLPSFGGKGMWGHHVHEAVLKVGCKVSGCTVHFCTDEYDNGPIIVQRTCDVKEDDTANTLAARVFEQECIAFPQAIRLFAEGRLQVQDGIVRIRP